MNWSKRLSSLKKFKFSYLINVRLTFAHEMLQLKSKFENWYNVRFNDEHHEKFDFTRRQLIIRKLDRARRIKSKNVQHCIEFNKKNKKRIHVWTVVNHNFKFKLFFYSIFTNSNDKLIQVVYIDILKRFNNLTHWLHRNDDIVL